MVISEWDNIDIAPAWFYERPQPGAGIEWWIRDDAKYAICGDLLKRYWVYEREDGYETPFGYFGRPGYRNWQKTYRTYQDAVRATERCDPRFTLGDLVKS